MISSTFGCRQVYGDTALQAVHLGPFGIEYSLSSDYGISKRTTIAVPSVPNIYIANDSLWIGDYYLAPCLSI